MAAVSAHIRTMKWAQLSCYEDASEAFDYITAAAFARVHAKHLGYPIFGDETYSGGSTAAVAFIGSSSPSR